MPGERWLDDLARGLAAGRTRKDFLRLAGSLALGALLGRTHEAEAARPPARAGCPGGCESPESSCCGGVCVVLGFDRDNCGRCGNACRVGQDCCGGRCVNVSGKDPDNCGCCGCGCLAGQEVCIAGRCKPSCPSGKTRCGRKCVDTATSKKHCGGCRQKCRKGQTCADGRCVDRDGAVSCGGVPCPDATFVCKGGACACPDEREPCVGPSRPGRAGTIPATCCPSGRTCCDGTCVDTRTDRQHCGACDLECDPTHDCRAGQCEFIFPCPTDWESCPSGPAHSGPFCCAPGYYCCGLGCCPLGKICNFDFSLLTQVCCAPDETPCGGTSAFCQAELKCCPAGQTCSRDGCECVPRP